MSTDKQIKAKPKGWRFKGDDYSRPKKSEQGTPGTYYEDRKNRSDKDLQKKLVTGGELTEIYEIGTGKELWDRYTVAQREHFLEDHTDEIKDDLIENTLKELRDMDYRQLPHRTRTAIDKHQLSMQYVKGGMLAPNQMVITEDDGTRWFQSYNFMIAKITPDGKVYLDEKYWDYSKTTGKYRNQFLGEDKKQTERKILSGEYTLTNLNTKEKGGTMASGGGVGEYERGKNYPVKTISASDCEKHKLSDYPNFSKTGSISGMKKMYYGKDALLVKCGSYIYNVTSNPEIYFTHAYEDGGTMASGGKIKGFLDMLNTEFSFEDLFKY